MVDVSTTTLPGPSSGSIASTTSTTCGESGTQSRTTSPAFTTPAGSPPSAAPAATAASTGPRLRDATVTWCPFASRLRVMGSPMAPRPTNPTFTRPPPSSPEQQRARGHALAAGDQARAGVRDLGRGRPPQLAHTLGDQVEAVDVRLRHASTGRADRETPVGPLDGSVVGEVGALAALAEPVSLEGERDE